MIAIGQRALAARLHERRVLQRQEDRGAVVERFELSRAQAEVAPFRPRVGLVPIGIQEPRDRPYPGREAFEVSC